MKKIVSVIAAVLLCFSLSSCGENGESSSNNKKGKQSVASQSVSLAYSKGDSLSPFECETQVNYQLSRLVYDGLYTLNGQYEPVSAIAQSGIISGNSVNVTLSQAYFSNGDLVTANDISFSFEKARVSPAYSESLKNFASVSVSSPSMLVFTLISPDPYALSCLVFPVVKAGDESDLPVGCGRYKFVKSGEEIGLEVNSFYKDFSPNIGNVTLVPIKDVDSMQSSLSIGNTVFSFDDLSKGEYLRLSAKNVNVTLNHLIFIGINGANSYFSSSFLRRAVNAAVDRENIALSSFRGYAKTAYSPFNPDWYQLISRDLVFQPDVETAEDFVISSGVDVKNRYINLIVFEDNAFKCEAAELIEESLEKIGFAVNVKKCSEEEYKNLVEIGGYDLYIGEVALTENMDLNCFFAPENTFGVDGEGQSALRYFELMSGNCEIMDFINTFNEDIPFVPLCYRCAVASYTNSLKADFTPNSFDVFSDFESWKLN